MERSPASRRDRVAVALSGGVDSAVAALLLVERGLDVVGFFLRNGVEETGPGARRSCCSASDASDARRVAAALGIPFYALDVSDAFEGLQAEFVEAYVRGRTPNPCVRCNTDVKFGRLLEVARAVGAARVATGHYARLVEGPEGRVALLAAVDRGKDQSYVLSLLRPEQLRRASFPLGSLTKDAVRARARSAGLPVADKPESQELCFVPSGDYRDFVRRRAPWALREGPIRTVDGRVVGRHEGVAGFTIGQRRGLGVALGGRRHVVRLDPARREVVVGTRTEASASGFLLEDPNPLGLDLRRLAGAVRVRARIRHRHPGRAALLVRESGGRLVVRFERPEFAVTPGQVAALYADGGDEVLLAGRIGEVLGAAAPPAAPASPLPEVRP